CLQERNHWGSVALALAASNGQFEVCELLLRKGANLEAKDNYGSTPLIRAAKNGHLQIVDLLLRARANVDERDWKGNPAQFYAAQGASWFFFFLSLCRHSPTDYTNRGPQGRGGSAQLDARDRQVEHGAAADPQAVADRE